MATSNLLLFRLAEYLRARKESIVTDSVAQLRKEGRAPGEMPWTKWLGPVVQETSDRLMARAAMVEPGDDEILPPPAAEPAPQGIERILTEGPVVRNTLLRALNRFQAEQADRHDFTALEMTEARQETLQDFDRLVAGTVARWIAREHSRTATIDPHALCAVYDGLKGVLGLLRLAVETVPPSSRIHISAAVQQLARLTGELGEASGASCEGAPATAAEPAPAPPPPPAPAPPPPPAPSKEPLRLAPLHVSSFVRTLTEAFRPAAEGKGLRFETRCSPAPEIIRTDAAKLHQAASLILNHAVSNTATGGIVMTAGLLTAGRWTLGVRDTGPALPPELLSGMLLGLAHASPGSSESALNIAIARDLADLLGGQLEAESRPQEGTQFRLTLPLN